MDSVFRFVRSRAVAGTAQAFQQSTAAAMATLTGVGPVRLVAARGGSGLFQGVVVPDGHEAQTGVVQLAQAVGARAVPAPAAQTHPWRSDGQYVAVVRARRRQSLAFAQSQNGLDPVAVMDTVSTVLAPGSWVEVAVARPARFELARWRRWLGVVRAGLVTHPSTSTSTPVVVSLYAGADTRSRAEAVLRAVTATIPGFDVECRLSRVCTRTAGARWGAAAAGLAGTAAAGVSGLPNAAVGWAWAAAGACALLGVLRSTGLTGSRWRGWRSRLPGPVQSSRVRVDVRRLAVGLARRADGGRAELVPAWPLDEYAFMLAPGQFAGLVAPQSSGMSGREVPGELRERVGPLLGRDGDGFVYIPDADMSRGLAVVGAPGMGKSALLQSVAGYQFLEQAAPSGAAAAPGQANALVVFEPKKKGAQAYRRVWQEVAARVGPPNPLYVVDLADPACRARVGLVRSDQSPRARAESVTDALERAFESGAVGAASKEALVTALWAGHYVDQDVLAAARARVPCPAFTGRASFVRYGHVLLAGQGDEAGVALAAALRDKLVAPGADEQSREVAYRLETLYGKHTPGQRDQQVKAPRNKLAQLACFDHLFDPDQDTMSFEQILERHANVVLVTGPANGHAMSDGQAELLSALLAGRLKNAIERICDGWQEQARHCTPIVDELSILARAAPEALRWFRDQGRSYGVRPIYATQYPGQVPAELRTSLLTFPVLVSFKADEAGIASEIAAQLGVDGSVWQAADVATLQPHHAAVRSSVGFASRPAFTVQTLWWRDDPARWAAAQRRERRR